jgi:sulfur carrier protein
MEIIVNNQPKQIPEQDQFTVQQLLHLEIPGKQQGIAVAINNRVVSKANWASTHIFEQDHIIIIKATQGG